MRTPRRRALLSVAGTTLLLVLATACGSGSGDSADDRVGATVPVATEETPEPTASATDGTSPPASGDTNTTPTEQPAAVPEALQFTAPLVGGGTFDGAAFAGRPTVFWFWAPT